MISVYSIFISISEKSNFQVNKQLKILHRDYELNKHTALISADWVTPAQVHYFQETVHCFESDSSAQHKNLLI